MRTAAAVTISLILGLAGASPALAQGTQCAGNPGALGVTRTVEIDTATGPGFGFEQYKQHDFLLLNEVVLTFDDGPWPVNTRAVLDALAQHCVKATFFPIGKHALWHPDILKQVAAAGHTIGGHTWSHANLGKGKGVKAEEEIEKGFSAIKLALGANPSPFFRFPFLQDPKDQLAYLGTRNIAMFSTDVDSFDFKLQPPEHLVKGVMQKLEKSGKGILLMHDIHKNTAKALPLLLSELKAKGFKIVHIRAKAEVQTLAEYDAAIEKDAKGLPQAGAEKATSSIVKTIEGDVPASEAAQAAPAAAPKAAAVVPAEPAPTAAAEPAQRAMEPTAAAPATTQDAAGSANASPPGTTSSITRSVDGDAPPNAAKPAEEQGDAKSMSLWAKQLWDSWFSK